MPVSTGLFHVVNCLAVAGELERRGVEVAFAVKASSLERILQSGFSRVYPLLEAEDQADYFSKLSVFCEPAYIDRCVADELRVMRDYRPDLVVNDGRFTVGISAGISALKWASLVLPIQMPAGLKAAEIPLQEIRRRDRQAFDAWMRQVFGIPESAPVPPVQAEAFLRVAQRFGEHFHPVQTAHGLEPANSIYDLLLSPYLNLIPSYPGLSPVETAPADATFLGYLPGKSPVGSPVSGESKLDLSPDPERPLLYVTFGGLPGPIRATGTRFVGELLEVLAALPVRLVVSHPEPQTLPHSPAIQATRFVPSHRVFGAGALAQICHGGLGTLLAALANGVPSLAFPFSLEHLSNVAFLGASGAGLWSFPTHFAPDQLADKVDRLLQADTYRDHARRAERAIARLGGAPLAADLLRAMLE
jgi:UDP:flavonoid glycosyltransferase YjiC (YdhE family)